MIGASRLADAPEYRRTARDLVAQVERLCDLEGACPDERLVIGVAGESGSGKSVTAVALARELEELDVPTGVLHQDDYFIRPPRVNHAHRERDIGSVGPREVNLALMARHVADFRAGRAVDAPLVDYPGDCFLTRRLDFAPLAVLVVEGTYALMLDDLDVRIFMEATHDDTAERRRARNRDIDAPFVREVLRIEHGIIAPQSAVAHLIVGRDFAVRRGPAPRESTT